MKRKLSLVVLLLCSSIFTVFAQEKTISGKVTSAEDRQPMSGVTVKVKNTKKTTLTNNQGSYNISAKAGEILQFSHIGKNIEERKISSENVINVALSNSDQALDEVVVTALGSKVQQRSLGTAQQSVSGDAVAQTQRENFVNALQGRIAGVDVTSTSGVPGASSSITIRGVSSISSSNQPLFIVDGLPIDNKTFNTSALVSDASSSTALFNRGTDYSNRIADINPQDIDNITVLKGPEAAALYGIDAANGAIVITTKRGKAGEGKVNYNNSFRIEQINKKPEIQRVYGLGVNGSPGATSFNYFGPKYPDNTTFYDNIDGFFKTGFTQKHNLSFEGGSQNANYRISTAYTNQQGIVPNTNYSRINISGATHGNINSWIAADLSINYSNSSNAQPFKGTGGPLIGLLLWPSTDDAKDYLTPSGSKRVFSSFSSEVDNPYYNVNRNSNSSKNNRVFSNLGLILTPAKWLSFNTNIGFDVYSNQIEVVRDPNSSFGLVGNGIIDQAVETNQNLNVQSYFTIKPNIGKDFDLNIKLGNAIQNLQSKVNAAQGQNFLDPNFVSMNNTAGRNALTTFSNRRLLGFFAAASIDYKKFLYLNVTGRNDISSTLPQKNNSFFYPSVSTSFVFTDVPALSFIKEYISAGKIRAGIAQVGRDARPYAIVPSLQYKTTVGGGYGYGFTGPNLDLMPESATSYEVGTELSFLKNRLSVDFTYYNKVTNDQIVNDIRGSYGTGYVLFNLNGASTQNHGYEAMITGKIVQNTSFTWDVIANFNLTRGKVKSLPNSLPESYVSDTWVYGNVRNGVVPGKSTTSLTGYYYLKNNNGDILINPSNGLPLRSTVFIDAGYDRNPKFTLGLTNTFTYKNFRLNFLLDFRKGGDVLNATQHFLTTRGLALSTLDRMEPRVIKGVLKDGLENSANPTVNNISITPYYDNSYYTNLSEELYIEKDINWVRLRDVTLNFSLPNQWLGSKKILKSASIFVTGTDLFVITNYSGLDPITNGNSAAVGGSGGVGIDFGNFPIPRGINFGINIGL